MDSPVHILNNWGEIVHYPAAKHWVDINLSTTDINMLMFDSPTQYCNARC